MNGGCQTVSVPIDGEWGAASEIVGEFCVLNVIFVKRAGVIARFRGINWTDFLGNDVIAGQNLVPAFWQTFNTIWVLNFVKLRD